MKWSRVMLPVFFEEFKLICIFWLSFSIHYHCQLVKGQPKQKSGGLQPPSQSSWFLWTCVIIYVPNNLTD